MLIAVRPPEYSDEDKVDKEKGEGHIRHAVAMYWCLFFYHLGLATMSYVETFVSASIFRYTPAIMITATVFMLTKIFQNWLFIPGDHRDAMTHEQESFEAWLWIEVLMVFGQMVSAALFSIVRRIMKFCNKDEYVIESQAHRYMGQTDFLNYWTNHLGMLALNVQPFVILLGMRMMPTR